VIIDMSPTGSPPPSCLSAAYDDVSQQSLGEDGKITMKPYSSASVENPVR